MQHPAYEVFLPATRTTGAVFASPHSGRDYAGTFGRRSVLDAQRLRSSEDAFIDKLYAAAPDHGAPLIAALAPRAYVDLNRGAEELDPALIRGIPRSAHNPRVASGLGVIPRVVAGGREIYLGKISRDEAEERLKCFWHPYHERLQALVDEAHLGFGQALVIDCHSMPHEAVENLCRSRPEKPEVVLGDRFGAAAGAGIVDRIEAAFCDEGLRVARNVPFAGAFTAQHYGRPSRRQHVVQIEIDRSLYMDEATLQPSANFSEMKQIITRVIAEIADLARREDLPLAAE